VEQYSVRNSIKARKLAFYQNANTKTKYYNIRPLIARTR